jgi:molybdate transport system ATP-binding protein
VDGQGTVTQGPKAAILQASAQEAGGSGTEGATARRARRLAGSGGSTAGREPLVEMRDLSVRAGRKWILRGLSWTIRAGERWAVFGPNGAGKTTLLNLIQGDHPQAYALDLRLFGRSSDSTQAVWEARERIGWLSPELHLHHPEDWPVLDVVCSGYFNSLGLHQPCSRRQRAVARRWLVELGLGGCGQRGFGELSAGQQRLALLARAVVKRPRLLILDEACQGLDAGHRGAVLAAVDRLVEGTGAALVFTTHRREELPQCVTKVLSLKAGHGVLCTR